MKKVKMLLGGSLLAISLCMSVPMAVYAAETDTAGTDTEQENGEISWCEYFRTIWPDVSDEQRQAWLGMSYDEYEQLYK